MRLLLLQQMLFMETYVVPVWGCMNFPFVFSIGQYLHGFDMFIESLLMAMCNSNCINIQHIGSGREEYTLSVEAESTELSGSTDVEAGGT